METDWIVLAWACSCCIFLVAAELAITRWPPTFLGEGGLFQQHIAKPPQPESVCIAINGSERKKMAVLGDEEVCID